MTDDHIEPNAIERMIVRHEAESRILAQYFDMDYDVSIRLHDATAAMLRALRSENAALKAERDALRAEQDALQQVLVDVTAHLVAAHSLLKRGGKKAAGSDKMFTIMLKDYEASIERGRNVVRAALKGGE